MSYSRRLLVLLMMQLKRKNKYKFAELSRNDLKKISNFTNADFD